jgi:hypothetical protein
MGPLRLPLNKPLDSRGFLHKAFQLAQGDEAVVYITVDPKVLEQVGKSMEVRSGDGIVWSEILRLTSDRPYAPHVGLGAGIMIVAKDDVVVMGMAQS